MKLERLKELPAFHKPNFEPRKRPAQILLLVPWALIQYFMGNRFYVLLIIALFLMLVLSRPPHFTIVAISVLAIVIFTTPTVATWKALIQSTISTVQHPQLSLENILSPNTGKSVLPSQVRQMLALLQIHHLASYRLSNLLGQDLYIQGPMIEAAWPIKLDSTSPYLFSLPNEIENTPTCTLLDTRKDVVLEHCH